MRRILTLIAVATLGGCKYPVPPPLFTPRPPYPPDVVDPSGRPMHDPFLGGIQDIPGPSQEAAEADADYPVAIPTATPNEVLSPYPPNHRINVQGFDTGQLARDPHNQKIFRIP